MVCFLQRHDLGNLNLPHCVFPIKSTVEVSLPDFHIFPDIAQCFLPRNVVWLVMYHFYIILLHGIQQQNGKCYAYEVSLEFVTNPKIREGISG